MEAISEVMRSLQDISGSDSDSSIDGGDIGFEETAGWSADTELDRFAKDKSAVVLINEANRRVPLESTLKRFSISFEGYPSSSGWVSIRCPFPDHRDTTPSFGFNVREHFFKCHGCGRGGGSVQFISALENREKIEVAKHLLRSLNIEEEDIVIDIEERERTQIDELLLAFSKEVNQFISKHRSQTSLKYAEKVTFILDNFLAKHVPDNSIDLFSLKGRLENLREKLNYFDRLLGGQ